MKRTVLLLAAVFLATACSGDGFDVERCDQACRHAEDLCGVLPLASLDDCLDLCASIEAGTMDCNGVDQAVDCALASNSCTELLANCDLNFDCVGTTTARQDDASSN